MQCARGAGLVGLLGTVYLIYLSENADQVLPFALAACFRERGQALGIRDIGLRFANPT